MVPSDLADQLLRIASKEGKPLSRFVEEHLTQIVEATGRGHRVRDAVKHYEVAMGLRASGAVFIPTDIMKFFLQSLPGDQMEKLNLKWYEAGAWYGKYLLAKFPDPVGALHDLLRASWWGLDEAELIRMGGGIELRCISLGLSAEETEFLRSLIEGAMHSLGHKTIREETARGIIVLSFRPTTGELP